MEKPVDNDNISTILMGLNLSMDHLDTEIRNNYKIYLLQLVKLQTSLMANLVLLINIREHTKKQQQPRSVNEIKRRNIVVNPEAYKYN